jgi:hypothetical protein
MVEERLMSEIKCSCGKAPTIYISESFADIDYCEDCFVQFEGKNWGGPAKARKIFWKTLRDEAKAPKGTVFVVCEKGIKK